MSELDQLVISTRPGMFASISQAYIPPLSPSLHYSHSLFEGMSIIYRDGKAGLFHPTLNLERLRYNVEELGWKWMGYSDADIIGNIFALTAMNGFYKSFREGSGVSIKKAGREIKRLYVRPLVYTNSNAIGLGSEMKPELLLAVAPMGHYLPEKKQGIDVMLFPYPRIVSFPGLKTASGYQIAIYAKAKTNLFNLKSERQCPETIFTNKEGYVVEGSGENIFMLSEGKLVTPLPSDGALPGITIRIVSYVAEQLGIDCEFGKMTLEDIGKSDGIFLTGNAAGIVPVNAIAEVDKSYELKRWHELGSGANETIRKIKDEYEKLETWQGSERFHTFMEDWYLQDEIIELEGMFSEGRKQAEYTPPCRIPEKFKIDSLWINEKFSMRNYLS